MIIAIWIIGVLMICAGFYGKGRSDGGKQPKHFTSPNPPTMMDGVCSLPLSNASFIELLLRNRIIELETRIVKLENERKSEKCFPEKNAIDDSKNAVSVLDKNGNLVACEHCGSLISIIYPKTPIDPKTRQDSDKPSRRMPWERNPAIDRIVLDRRLNAVEARIDSTDSCLSGLAAETSNITEKLDYDLSCAVNRMDNNRAFDGTTITDKIDATNNRLDNACRVYTDRLSEHTDAIAKLRASVDGLQSQTASDVSGIHRMIDLIYKHLAEMD